MRSPDEIKKGLESCGADECHGEHTGCPYKDDVFCIMHICGDALAYITQLEARVPTWVSIHDIEPDDNTFAAVLVRNSENWGFSTFKIAAWVDGKWIGICSQWKVTHWMPLPKMPKEE